MIRVLHVVTNMARGGLETFLMNYYRKIDRNEIQFDFLVHRYERADYDDEIEAFGGKIYRIPVLNPFSKKYKNSLRQFFTEHPEYRIIHVHQDCLSSIILRIATECGVPVRIAHSHSSCQDKNLKYPIKLYFRHFIPKYATHLLACGKEAGEWMFEGADFKILNNAIDAAKYIFSQEKRLKMRQELNIGKDDFVLGHVGRFSPVKNHDFIVDVFAKMLQHKKAKLLLVGDGELRKDIELKVEQAGLADKVIFTGLRSDVPDLLQAMDVFIFPSLYEGLGIVVIEAQASGIPCFISNKVPSECKITNLVHTNSLDNAPEVWSTSIERNCNVERCNTCDNIRSAGYDVGANVKKLQEYYKSL